MKEFRFAVGKPNDRRSSVWKVWTRKGDVYIQSRMMGCYTKVSIHESGKCQWSNTDEWVKKSGNRYSERHITRWQRTEPSPSMAAHVFRIVIPESELRKVDVQENLSKVNWITTPPEGHAAIVDCHISPPSETPFIGTSNSNINVISLELSNSRWLMVLVHTDPINEQNTLTVINGRNDLVRRAQMAGVILRPEHRAVLFVQPADGARGMIEIVPA